MSTVAEFEAAPVGATATSTSCLIRAIRTFDDDADSPWLTSLGGWYSAEGMVEIGFTLDPSPVPATAREALELAWELAHPVKDGQIIPVGTEFFYKNAHKVLVEEFSFKITASTVRSHRTLDPLPDTEPDWLDAPAVRASTKAGRGRHTWVVIDKEVWSSPGQGHVHWSELRDVTPLYPKEADK